MSCFPNRDRIVVLVCITIHAIGAPYHVLYSEKPNPVKYFDALGTESASKIFE